MKISIVMPCFNAARTVRYQLDALVAQKWSGSWEVIVSDNGSTDQSLRVLAQYRARLPNLRVVDSSSRRGAAHARNVGVLAATGDAILFCDADDEVGSNWLETMGETLSEYDFAACCLDTAKLNERWLQDSWQNSQRDGLITFLPNFFPCAAGSSIGIKRVLHDSVGGFNESIAKYEDIDYCWRVQLTGTKLHFVSNTCIHYRYPTKFRNMYQQMRLMGSDWVRLYKEYQSLGMPKIASPVRTGIRAWKNCLKRVPRAHHRVGFARLVREFGWRVGRLQGSVKYRILAF